MIHHDMNEQSCSLEHNNNRERCIDGQFDNEEIEECVEDTADLMSEGDIL